VRDQMQFIDYDDDGVVPMVESEEVETVIENILEYVEARFEILDKMGNRDADIFAICEEFHEWGTAEQGDDLFYFVVPTFS